MSSEGRRPTESIVRPSSSRSADVCFAAWSTDRIGLFRRNHCSSDCVVLGVETVLQGFNLDPNRKLIHVTSSAAASGRFDPTTSRPCSVTIVTHLSEIGVSTALCRLNLAGSKKFIFHFEESGVSQFAQRRHYMCRSDKGHYKAAFFRKEMASLAKLALHTPGGRNLDTLFVNRTLSERRDDIAMIVTCHTV
ncbi:hypothetical protein RB195_009455 [Necator americanus]|uniref:Uncharacterized protein n=1 Tax=Necator americanus TaxID=51031 RepID=A0ABR1CTD2_NECAM